MSLFCVLLASIKRHYGVMDGVLGYARLHQTETRPSLGRHGAWRAGCPSRTKISALRKNWLVRL